MGRAVLSEPHGHTHIFNFEDLSTVSNTVRVWRFDDALFTWESTGISKQKFDLWSGTLDFAKPLYLGSNGGEVHFTIHPEATLSGSAEIQQRGNVVTHTTFLGGRHSLNGIYLKDGNSNAGRTWLHVTNDAVVVFVGRTFPWEPVRHRCEVGAVDRTAGHHMHGAHGGYERR